MTILKLKGNEFEIKFTTGSASRYAALFRNNIIACLKELCVSPNYIRIDEESNGLKKAKAEVYWYMEGRRCYYSYARQPRYVDNLQVIAKLIEIEMNKIFEGNKTPEEFVLDFREEDNLIEKRKDARTLLGFDEHEIDMEIINKQFKKMAREAHPDMERGNTERFKQINEAHKILRAELE